MDDIVNAKNVKMHQEKVKEVIFLWPLIIKLVQNADAH